MACVSDDEADESGMDEPDAAGPGAGEPEAPRPAAARPARPDLPRATPGASPAAQVATVAVAVVVLLVVGVVFLLQGPPDRSAAQPTPTLTGTAVPELPPSDFEPSRAEDLPELPTFAASLCPSITLTEPITVLSFNIHGGLAKRGGLQLDRVAREINSWKPDVVLLQEVDDHRRRSGRARQAEVLGGLTDMSWVYGGNHQRPDGGPIGNAILSKYRVVKWENILLPRAGGKEQRGLLHAVLDVGGTEISFYSTHFDHISGAARIVQAQAVTRTLAQDPRPKIFGGDLNATPGSKVLGVLRSSGLGDAWAVGSGNGNTAPNARPRHRIDFVLHDGWFEPLQVAVLASGVSDHRAVWTRIEFRKELACIKIGG